MLFLATLAVLLMQTLAASSCRTTVAAGNYHTCAILDDAAVKCWGYAAKGELGYGDTSTRGNQPNEMGEKLPAVELGTGRTAVSVSASYYFTCALLDSATVKCWGKNEYGELGYGDTRDRGDDSNEMGETLPSVELGRGRTAVSVSTGRVHACALLDDATVKCWGNNANGALGYGDTSDRGDVSNEMGDRLPAVDLGAGRTAVSVSASKYHVCAVLDDATVKCWGFNSLFGVLGQGDKLHRGDDSNGGCPARPTRGCGGREEAWGWWLTVLS